MDNKIHPLNDVQYLNHIFHCLPLKFLHILVSLGSLEGVPGNRHTTIFRNYTVNIAEFVCTKHILNSHTTTWSSKHFTKMTYFESRFYNKSEPIQFSTLTLLTKTFLKTFLHIQNSSYLPCIFLTHHFHHPTPLPPVNQHFQQPHYSFPSLVSTQHLYIKSTKFL